MTRYRLLARAQMHGTLREPGYEFTLAEGERGPHKGVHVSHDKVDNDPANGIDANRIVGNAIDIPLYEEIKE